MANFLQVTVNDLFADEDEGLLEQPQIQQDPVQLDDEIIAQLDLLTEQEKQLLLAAARGFVSQRRGEGR
ncbi:hypothetical protein MQW28_04345 [Cereibacter sphaeroides]